jgi:hypothetical protein
MTLRLRTSLYSLKRKVASKRGTISSIYVLPPSSVELSKDFATFLAPFLQRLNRPPPPKRYGNGRGDSEVDPKAAKVGILNWPLKRNALPRIYTF